MTSVNLRTHRAHRLPVPADLSSRVATCFLPMRFLSGLMLAAKHAMSTQDPIETIFLVWLRTSKELTPENYPEFFGALDSAYAVEVLTPSLVLIRAGKLDVLYFEDLFMRTLGTEQWLITQTNGIAYRLPPELGQRVYTFVKQSQIWQSAPPW